MAAARKASSRARASKEADKAFRVALILPGVIADQSWNAVGYAGLMAVRTELGAEVAYSESVPSTRYDAVFKEYAQDRYNLVIGHGSEFGDAAVRVSKEFPNVYFAVMNSGVNGPNLAGMDTKNEEMGYISGYIAGLLTKTKVVAFIGATRIVAMARAEQGFLLGVKAACPDCSVLVDYIGVFDDEAKGRRTALGLIAQRADVLFNNDDEAGLGALKAAEEQSVLAIGSDDDQKSIAPKAVITSVLAQVTPMMVAVAKEVFEGTFIPNQVRMNGFETGTYELAPLDLDMISSEQAERLYAEVEKLKEGKIRLPHL